MLYYGIVNAIHQLQGDFPKDSSKESAVHGWKKTCQLEFESREDWKRVGVVKELPPNKLGCPLMLG